MYIAEQKEKHSSEAEQKEIQSSRYQQGKNIPIIGNWSDRCFLPFSTFNTTLKIRKNCVQRFITLEFASK